MKVELINPLSIKAVDMFDIGESKEELVRARLFGANDFYASTDADFSHDLWAIKLSNVVIRGADVIFSQDAPVFFRGFYPSYAATMFPFHNDQKSGIGGKIKKEIIECNFPVVSITHWTSCVYGHFLLEMLPKIVCFLKLKMVIPDAKILISSIAGEKIIAILKDLVASDDVVVFDGLKQEVRPSCVFVLSSLVHHYANRSVIHPLMKTFTAIAQSRSQQFFGSNSGFSRKIYVSKSNWRSVRAAKDYRCIENEEKIKSYLEGVGFNTVYPEQLSWLGQVCLFSSSNFIVGEYTSALHNTIFSLENSAVVSINRVNGIQDAISKFCGHTTQYVMPDDGIARLPNRGTPAGYTIDLEKIKSAVSQKRGGENQR